MIAYIISDTDISDTEDSIHHLFKSVFPPLFFSSRSGSFHVSMPSGSLVFVVKSGSCLFSLVYCIQ